MTNVLPEEKSMPVLASDEYRVWIVAVSCSMIAFFLFGVFRSYGILYLEIIITFHTTRAQASWPLSLCASIMNVVGWYRGEKRVMSSLFQEFDVSPLITFAQWTLPNFELARMHLLSCIRTFHHPSPQCHTALKSLYLLRQRKSSHPQKTAANQKRRKRKTHNYNSFQMKCITCILEKNLINKTNRRNEIMD
ncbi:uncharacterized protein LOC143237761 isoform X5 [Tachypleus tridentatus]|uniref:uncharacterized protein LOC143237761 isoform X5 n=1 Tax=Tachypleus tridentatus TaxID=6853 RepID=UPI003FCF4D54